MSALREVLARFDIVVNRGALDAASKGVDGLSDKLSKVVGVVSAGAVYSGVKNFVTSMVDLGDSLAATSDKLGLSTDTLQQWRLAAQLSDVEAGALDASLGKFQVNLAKAADGAADAKAVFGDLGVTDLSAALKDTPSALLAVADSIAQIEDAGTRNAKLIEVFGKQGAALGPMFSKGSEGIKDLLAQLEATGGGLSADAIEAMAGLDDATIKYDASVTALKGRLALVFMPALERVVTGIGKMTAAFANSDGAATKLQAVFAVLGAAGLVAGLKLAAPYLGLAVLIAALILIVDDLITGFKGGDSVTGRFLDKIFGKGSGASIFKQAAEDARELWKRIKEADGAGGALEETFATVGASLTRFFADELPEAVDIARERIQAGTADTTDWGIAIAGALNPVQWVKDFQRGINSIISAVSSFADKTIAAAKDIGTRFVRAIVDGLTGAVPELEDGAGKAADALVNSIKNKIQMRSPPRVALDIGEQFGSAIGAGSLASIGKLKSAGAMMGGALASSTTNAARAANVTNAHRFAATNQVSIVVQGTGVQAVKEGVRRGLSESNEATLAALENLAPGTA